MAVASTVQEELGAFEVIEQLRTLAIDLGPTFPSRLLSNDLLFDRILDSASPGTLVRLSRTCRQAHDAIKPYIPRAFDIDRALRRFFDDPLAFRSLQAQTGTLISGSFALQFFARTFYCNSDLDLYCNYGDREEVGLWLLDEGYAFVPSPRQDPEFAVAVDQARTVMNTSLYARLRGVSAIYTFTKESESVPGDILKVQIIVAHRSPMEIILNFHSSQSCLYTLSYWCIKLTVLTVLVAVVMNVIAYDRAYCLYPRATFEARLSLYLKTVEPRDVQVIEKYRARGWDFVHDWPTLNPSTTMPYDPTIVPMQPRWIGDKHTWSIPLALTGVTLPAPYSTVSPALETDPCFCTSWAIAERRRTRLAGWVHFGMLRGMRVDYQVVDADGFRARYVVAPGESGGRVKAAMAALQHLYLLGRTAADEDDEDDGDVDRL